MSGNAPVFVHAADLHLGAPLKSLGSGLSADVRAELIALVDSAFDNLINETIRLNAEFLVLAGDIYDDANREAGAQLRFVRGLKRLVDNGIPVYMVHGNHDPLANDVVNVIRLPEGVKVFRSGELEMVRHKLRDGGNIIVAGVSYSTTHETNNLALKFREIARGDSRAVVGVLHTNVGGTATGHGDYAPCKESDLESSPVDYWALGHVHKRHVKQFGSNKFWAYPGNLQGRDSGEAGHKGALVIPIHSSGVGQPQFLPLGAFRFEKVDIDCAGLVELTDIASAIREKLPKEERNGRIILRVHLHGRTEAKGPVEKFAASNPTALEDALEEQLADVLNNGHVERVTYQLLPPLDIEELTRRDDLLGDVLRYLKTASPDKVLSPGHQINPELTQEEARQLLEAMRHDAIQQLLSPEAETA